MICDACGSKIGDDSVFCPYCANRIEAVEECTDYAYEAFISYRHLPHDKQHANRIQKSIEGFRIPRKLTREGMPSRLGKCFRDEDELPTTGSLPDHIKNALLRSRFLIVVCSNKTNESKWIRREVETFASLHGRDRILLALVDGEPDKSFPPLLLSRSVPRTDGLTEVIDTEPLAADLRDTRRRKQKAERLRLIAPLIGCGYDDLRQRQRQRQLRLVATTTSLIAAASVAFGSFSLYQQRLIEENYRATLVHESEHLAERAQELAAGGDRLQAIQVALAALPSSPESDDRPYVPAAQVALEDALGVYPPHDQFQSLYSLTDVSTGIDARAYSKSGIMAYFDTSECIQIVNIEDASTVCTIDVIGSCGATIGQDKTYRWLLEFVDDRLICMGASKGDGFISCFDGRSGDLLWQANKDEVPSCETFAVSHGQRTIAVVSAREMHKAGSYSRYAFLLNAEDGSLIRSYRFDTGSDSEVQPLMAFSDDDKGLAIAADSVCSAIGIDDGSVRRGDLNLAMGSGSRIEGIMWNGDVITTLLSDNLLASWAYYLNAYNTDMNLLWKQEGATNNSGPLLWAKYDLSKPTLKLCGTYKSEKDGARILAVMLDSNLVFLDERTGEEIRRISENAPYVGFRNGKDALIACLADGEVYARTIGSIGTKDKSEWDDSTGAFSYYGPECNNASQLANDKGSFLVSASSHPSALRVSRFMKDDEGWGNRLATSKEILGIFACNMGDKTYLAGASDTGLHIFSANDSSKSVEVPFEQMPEVDAEFPYCNILRPPANETSLLVCCSKKRGESGLSTSFVINEVLPETGEIVRQVNVDEFTPKDECRLMDGRRALLAVRSCYKNSETTYEGCIIPIDHTSDPIRLSRRFKSIDKMLYVQGNVAVLADGHVALFDASTGERIACDLDAHDGIIYIAAGSDKPYVATASDDGNTRLYDSTTGKLLWEKRISVGKVEHLVFSRSANSILQQDETGTLTLISVNDGTILATALSTFPRIVESWTLDNPFVLAVHCEQSRNSFTTGSSVATINLAKDSFGPTSLIPQGQWLSADGTLVIRRSPIGKTAGYYAAHHYSLGELMDTARQTVEGHELSDAERNAYHLNE